MPPSLVAAESPRRREATFASVCVCVCVCVCLSVYLSMSVYLCMSVSLSVCMSRCILSVCMSVFLYYVSLCVRMFHAHMYSHVVTRKLFAYCSVISVVPSLETWKELPVTPPAATPTTSREESDKEEEVPKGWKQRVVWVELLLL